MEVVAGHLDPGRGAGEPEPDDRALDILEGPFDLVLGHLGQRRVRRFLARH